MGCIWTTSGRHGGAAPSLLSLLRLYSPLPDTRSAVSHTVRVEGSNVVRRESTYIRLLASYFFIELTPFLRDLFSQWRREPFRYSLVPH